MDAPPIRPFRGRARWGAAAANLLLAALAAGLVATALAAVPDDGLVVRALVAYTTYAALATAGLALALAATRRLPTLRSTREGFVLRSWRGEWWYAVALDSGVVVLAGVLAGQALGSPGWLGPGVLVALAGLYFLVRVLLSLAGRRRPEALWLTPDELVHDASWGRERVRREQVTRVRAATGSAHVVVDVDGPVERQVCPRPWRRGHPHAAGRIVADCSMTGHDSADLAAWLGAELALPLPRR